jgi:YebC/PmpR family DNA-binding regulatory protein
MAGHSKWKQIKHKKALLDGKKAKRFTKLIKEMTIAARLGGGDPTGNPRLRLLLEKSKEINMPQENAVRAIKKGTGELPGTHYESYTYEGYGPANIALIVEVLTDNKNKAIAELRHVFSRNNGRIADSGAVSWLFKREGVVTAELKGKTEDELMDLLLEYPVHTFDIHEDRVTITCDMRSLEEVRHALVQAGLTIDEAEIEWVASEKMAIDDEIEEEKAVNFLQALEELEDVQNVYTNLA